MVDADAIFAVVALTGLFISGWVASAQRGFLHVWAGWTVFCLILFPSILKMRGELTLTTWVGAVVLAPLAALIAWVWIYSGLRRRR